MILIIASILLCIYFIIAAIGVYLEIKAEKQFKKLMDSHEAMVREINVLRRNE